MENNKLNIEHLAALSNGLLILSDSSNVHLVLYTDLHVAIAKQIKIKVDKKIAAGVVPKSGFRITLTEAELLVVGHINKYQILKNAVPFRNAITRLLLMNR